MYQRPIFSIREGSIGTNIYFHFKIPGLFFQIFFEQCPKKKSLRQAKNTTSETENRRREHKKDILEEKQPEKPVTINKQLQQKRYKQRNLKTPNFNLA